MELASQAGTALGADPRVMVHSSGDTFTNTNNLDSIGSFLKKPEILGQLVCFHAQGIMGTLTSPESHWIARSSQLLKTDLHSLALSLATFLLFLQEELK